MIRMTMAALAGALAIGVPTGLAAQTRGAEPVTVEVSSIGTVDAKPSEASFTINYTATADSKAKAERDRAAKLAEVIALLQRQGITAAEVTGGPDDAAEESSSSDDEDMVADAADEKSKPASEYTAKFEREVKLSQNASRAQPAATALEALGVTVGKVEVALNDADRTAARREAKGKALQVAREDANVYASQLGQRVGRVVKISEIGNNMFLPALQEKLQQAVSGGKRGFEQLFESKPGTIRVDAGLVVTFELTR